eukprot:6479676-Amphidinium_carterae.1
MVLTVLDAFACHPKSSPSLKPSAISGDSNAKAGQQGPHHKHVKSRTQEAIHMSTETVYKQQGAPTWT